MRILMVHDEPIDDGYGAEAYVRRLVAGLRAAGDDVDVVAGEIRHRGVGRLRDLWDPGAREHVDRRAREFRADILHFHNVARELSPSVLGAAPAVPAVMTFHDLRLLGAHEHPIVTPRGMVEANAAALTLRRARRRLAATIGVSERVSGLLRRRQLPSVTTVPVPVPEPVTTPQPVTECRDVAVIARLTRDKGADVALEAFAAVMGPEAADRRILVAGDGPERSRLERLAAGPALRGRVEFLGRVDEAGISELLGRVRVVVVASQPHHRPEGSSLACVEAALHGRPVVASADPAVAELATALGGALVVSGQRAADYASALQRLVRDDALATELGERGRDNARRLHSVAAVTLATRSVYRGVLGRAT